MSTDRAPHISSFALKVAAIVGMTLCHVGVVFQSALPLWAYCVLEAGGGLTFPIMAFLVSEGYRHTHDLRRYAARLAAFALVAQVPYSVAFEPVPIELGEVALCPPITGNVLFTLLLGLGLLAAYDRMRCRPAFWALFCLSSLASCVLDWGLIGPVMILMCHILPEGQRRVVPAGLAVLALGLPAAQAVLAGDVWAAGTLCYELVGGVGAVALLRAYDGTRGRPLKWFFYLYYPTHLAVLAALAACLL